MLSPIVIATLYQLPGLPILSFSLNALWSFYYKHNGRYLLIQTQLQLNLQLQVQFASDTFKRSTLTHPHPTDPQYIPAKCVPHDWATSHPYLDPGASKHHLQSKLHGGDLSRLRLGNPLPVVSNIWGTR